MEGAEQDAYPAVTSIEELRATGGSLEDGVAMNEELFENTVIDTTSDASRPRSPSVMADIDLPELLPRQQGADLTQFNNFSTRQYDKYVFSLKSGRTGCYRRGALPVPLARNDTCLPGWYCKFKPSPKQVSGTHLIQWHVKARIRVLNTHRSFVLPTKSVK